MSSKKVIVFGPGPQFKGGMSNYTTSLAKALDRQPDTEVGIVSWTQQYPAIIPRDFIDRASKENKLAGSAVTVTYITNYNNPFTWIETVQTIREMHPDLVVIQWSVAVQGLPLSYIAKNLRKDGHIKVVYDLHFVIQKEPSAIDMLLSKRALKHADAYIVHAFKTIAELETLFPNRQMSMIEKGRGADEQAGNILKLYHPVYDMFKSNPAFDVEAQKKALNLKKHVFLFFGFIRKYKGLHFCIEAFAKLANERDDVSLLIVGESFWQTLDTSKLSTRVKQQLFGLAKSLFLKKDADEKDYNPLAQIKALGIEDKVTVINDFVPNEDVNKYFQVSDAILLFYEYATPSGVESMAYNFNMPVLASRVGHFPETIRHGYNGYLANPSDTSDMAKIMNLSIEEPIDKSHVAETAKEFSWDNYAKTILNYLD